jgi:DnaJ-class molecular chaperone
MLFLTSNNDHEHLILMRAPVDSDKRAAFDRHGSDPEARSSGMSSRASSASFANGSTFGGSQFDGEISPEDLFNMFFGGGMGGGGNSPSALHLIPLCVPYLPCLRFLLQCSVRALARTVSRRHACARTASRGSRAAHNSESRSRHAR